MKIYFLIKRSGSARSPRILSQINITHKNGFGRFNLAVYWRRKYKTKQEKSPWYLLTNLADLETAVKAYKQRFGIEALFKDCKSGGYNLEGSQASPDKLVRLVLLIALAMTSAWLQGEKTSTLGNSPYICRSKEGARTLELTYSRLQVNRVRSIQCINGY